MVIHLPGLIEEAEKNLQKGEGKVDSRHVACLYLHDLQGILFVGKLLVHIGCRITGMGRKTEDF